MWVSGLLKVAMSRYSAIQSIAPLAAKASMIDTSRHK